MDRIEDLVGLVPEEIRDALKSLGDYTRLAIMVHLMIKTDKNRVGSSFREIKNELGIRQGSLSNHLKNLLASGLIKNEYMKVEGKKEFSFYLPTNFGRNFMMKLLELGEEATSKERVNTVFFERAFDVSINSFKTTEDVNKFIEKRRGRKLRVRRIETPLVSRRGSIFRIGHCDVDELVDEALNES